MRTGRYSSTFSLDLIAEPSRAKSEQPSRSDRARAKARSSEPEATRPENDPESASWERYCIRVSDVSLILSCIVEMYKYHTTAHSIVSTDRWWRKPARRARMLLHTGDLVAYGHSASVWGTCFEIGRSTTPTSRRRPSPARGRSPTGASARQTEQGSGT